jgi:hypothetical protein
MVIGNSQPSPRIRLAESPVSMEHHAKMLSLMACHCLGLLSVDSATDRRPALAGVYQTWDDLITRWIGQQKVDLCDELGPPQFHKEAQDGMEELVWDMTLPSMPGQAEIYDTLPLSGGIDCRLLFFADAQGVVKAGRRVGCN